MVERNYQETIDFLYSRLPVFQDIGARAFKPGLYNTIELCKSLGNPETKYPCIHIGGTNGKGSTSHMLAAILQTAGYKVGLYTSPHLKSFTERIKVNGEEIDQSFIINFTNDNLSNIDRLEPSFFELTVAMAFSYFRDNEVDIAVIEVGMGGRLDSTNVITPILSLITNVSLDHTQFLGKTLDKIAFEKSGIIKKSVPVIVSQRQSDFSWVFEDVARQMDTSIIFGSDAFDVVELGSQDRKLNLTISETSKNHSRYVDLKLDLSGSYQKKNVCGVLAAVDVLRSLDYQISDQTLYKALEQVVSLTGLKGRWQKLRSTPLVYCDTAHNAAGLMETIAQFDSVSEGRKKFVLGFVSDKDMTTILSLFPVEADYYFTQPSNLRALPGLELMKLGEEFGLKGNYFSNVNEALRQALSESQEVDSIYVGGSTFVVADLDEI